MDMNPLLLLLSLPLIQEPAPAAPKVSDDPMATLKAAVVDLTDQGSYRFTLQESRQRPTGGRDNAFGGGGSIGGRDGGDAEQPPAPSSPVWEGVWQQGKPIMLRQDQFEVYRLGQVMVHRSGKDGAWQRSAASRGRFGGFRGGADRPQRGEGADRPQRPQRGEGADRPQRPQSGEGADRPQRPQRGEGADRPQRPQRGEGGQRPDFDPAMRQVFAARGLALPHEFLGRLPEQVDPKSLVQVRRDNGSVVIEAALSSEGARAIAMGGRGFGGRGNGPEMEGSGDIRLVIGADGHLQKFRIKAEVTGQFRDREFTMGSTREGKISQHGKCEVSVTPALQEMLKPDEAQEEEF